MCVCVCVPTLSKIIYLSNECLWQVDATSETCHYISHNPVIAEAATWKSHKLSGTLILCHNTRLHGQRVYLIAQLTLVGFCLSVCVLKCRFTRWTGKWMQSCRSWWNSSRPSQTWPPDLPSVGWPSRNAWARALTKCPDAAEASALMSSWKDYFGIGEVHMDSPAPSAAAIFKTIRGLSLPERLCFLSFCKSANSWSLSTLRRPHFLQFRWPF